MREQHGPAWTPTEDPELIKATGAALEPHGGKAFMAPERGFEPLDYRVAHQGTLWSQRVTKHPQCEQGECHNVTRATVQSDPSRYGHGYGYALSQGSFEMWRPHSWIHDRREDKIIEPTPIKRAKYFGIGLTDHETTELHEKMA